MRGPRMCSRFYCDDRGDRFCCQGCPRYSICRNPCLNSPEVCGLEDKDAEAKQKARRRRG